MTSPSTSTPYGYDSPASRGSGRSGLAITALVLAIAAVVISVGMSIVQFAMIGQDLSTVQLWAYAATAASVVTGIIALVALVLGILAVRGSRPAVSGAAAGIGAAHLFATVVTTLGPLVML